MIDEIINTNDVKKKHCLTVNLLKMNTEYTAE